MSKLFFPSIFLICILGLCNIESICVDKSERLMTKNSEAYHQFQGLLNACPDFQFEPYKIDPYLHAAIFLQEQGQATRLSLLTEFAEGHQHENQLIILMRMLFQSKEGTTFRRPWIGGAAFLANTDYARWKLEPIEITENIPFLITQGYVLGGRPESATMYLEYCSKNCDWSNLEYKIPTLEEKEAALVKMIRFNRLTDVLDKYERAFLKKQL